MKVIRCDNPKCMKKAFSDAVKDKICYMCKKGTFREAEETETRPEVPQSELDDAIDAAYKAGY